MEDVIRSEDLAAALAKAAFDKKARDLAVLDMQSLVAFTDVFVLVTATNRRHVRAIADGVREYAKRELELLPEGVEGMESGRWVLVDFGNVVVHIFDGPLRGFYNLDGLWSDAPRIEVPGLEDPEEQEAYFTP